MIKTIINAFKNSIIYSVIVAVLLGWFAYRDFNGTAFFQSNAVQRNAGYTGPIPHSGYGGRFYHK